MAERLDAAVLSERRQAMATSPGWWVHYGCRGKRRRSPRRLTTQELLDARGDAGGVQAVLGVEALRIAGLAEALHTDSFEWRRHHVAQHLGHRATETAVERVVLDRHDVAGLAR